MGTAVFMWGEVMLHAHLGQPLPEGVGYDEAGRPTRGGAFVDGDGSARERASDARRLKRFGPVGARVSPQGRGDRGGAPVHAGVLRTQLQGRESRWLAVRWAPEEAEQQHVTCVCLFTRIPDFFAPFGFKAAAATWLISKT